MPVEACLASVLSIRFDFGVPLEDIFPPNDIHPRLKYLFKKAFEACIPHGFNIEKVLRYGQGTLKEKLELKDMLVSALDYRIKTGNCAAGSYFWVLRHFFGLLPLPVCPKYTRGVQFEWAGLAEECKHLLRHHDGNQKGFLDYDIAQNINMLPIENVIMLSVMILFLRKLAVQKTAFKRRRKYDRVALKTLCEYFSSSMFIRPFRPGGFQKCGYTPLLLYLILRWHHISQHCQNIGHPTQFSEDEIFNQCKTRTARLSNVFFKPDVIQICKNIPYLVNFCNKYLKDSACQTELDLNGNIYGKSVRTCTDYERNAYKLAYIEEVLDEEGTENNNSSEKEDLYETAKEFAFTSILDEEQPENWNDVMKSTEATVKRVEGSFIYDDYDTFKKEDFNQVASSSFKEYLQANLSNSKVDLLSPDKRIPQSSTPKKESPDSENTYVRFPDVSTSDDDAYECGSQENFDLDDYKKNKCDSDREKLDEIRVADQPFKLASKTKASIAQKLFAENSPISVEGENSTQSLQDKNKMKGSRRYVFNRLRMSLKFLRTLTPKKSSFKMIESKIKYRRIRDKGSGNRNTI